MADEASVAAAQKAIAAQVADGALPPVGALANIAGITSPVPFLETTLDLWNKVMAVNATGTYLVTKAFLPDMIEQGFGRIVNMSSVSAQRGGGVFGKVPYSSAKAAILGFTKALARELGSSGVTVNAVTPGRRRHQHPRRLHPRAGGRDRSRHPDRAHRHAGRRRRRVRLPLQRRSGLPPGNDDRHQRRQPPALTRHLPPALRSNEGVSSMTTATTALDLATRVSRVREAAQRIRLNALAMGEVQGQGYVGQALGAADMLAAVYADQLRYHAEDPHWEGRDRFLLSTGHYAIGLYAALAEAGIIPIEELDTYGSDDSRLPMSGMASYTPGMEISGGSLGHGLTVAVGHGARAAPPRERLPGHQLPLRR